MRVLIVDDEPRYREYLAPALERWGHEVRTAADGAEAIEKGLAFRPDLLITDWMLRHHIHGLHVASVLSSLDPRLQTMLITGFDSSELRLDARHGQIHNYLGKPFELEDIYRAVEEAAQGRRIGEPVPVPFGVVRTAPQGKVLHLNDRAWALFGETEAGRSVGDLAALFPPAEFATLRAANGRWYAASPKAEPPVVWWMTNRPVGGGLLWVVLRQEDQVLQNDTRVRLLVGEPHPDAKEWPFDDQVLLLEGDSAVARLHAGQLEALGCTAYKVSDVDLALRLLDANPQIGIVIFDRELRGAAVGDVVDRLRSARPALRLVGNDSVGDPSPFRQLGVARFLPKPWRVTDLIRVLRYEPDPS